MDAIRGSGREERFTSLYRAHYGRVLAYCRRRLPSDAASEAVAETFLAAWRKLDHMSDDPLLWLYGIARGVVSNERRRLERSARLRVRLGYLAGDRREPDHSDQVAWEDPLLAAFDFLGSLEQEALRLDAWEGLGASQAAAVAGCSVTAFKVRLFRARRHMRRLLEVDAHGCATWACPSAPSTSGAPCTLSLGEEAR